MQNRVISQIEGGAKRLAEIASILAKYGIADWLDELHLDWGSRSLRSSEGERLTNRPTEERIRLALTELGTSGIKLGQMLSTRADLIGTKLATELVQLQAETPADSFEDVRDTLRSELAEPDEVFRKIETTPLASASIAQVHRAWLKNGQEVVIKVRHKGIENRVMRDLDILIFLADQIEKRIPRLHCYRALDNARYFRRTLTQELDFRNEKRFLEQFRKNFHDNDYVHFPTVYAEFSTEKLLTMEKMDGIPVTDIKALQQSEYDLDIFARRGASVYLDMIFRDGFYHADPHPGNLFLQPGEVVGIIDCGMTGRIDEEMREEIENLLLAVTVNDSEEVVEILCRIGGIPFDQDKRKLRHEMADIIDEFGDQTLDHFNLSEALQRVFDMIRKFGIILPHGFAMLLKTLVMLEGSSRRLAPNFSLVELLQPYYEMAVRRKLAPSRIARNASRTYRDWRRMIDALPRDLGDILSRAREGSFEIHHEHRRLEGTVDRLVQGILTASLFLGSSVMLSTKTPPSYAEFSLIGGTGLVIASILAFRLFLSIRRAGRWPL